MSQSVSKSRMVNHQSRLEGAYLVVNIFKPRPFQIKKCFTQNAHNAEMALCGNLEFEVESIAVSSSLSSIVPSSL
jgi:hypothetical protein